MTIRANASRGRPRRALLLASAMGLSLVTAEVAITASPAVAATITGTQGDDRLIKGTDKADVLRGLGGDDNLRGVKGDDVLHGGAGNDDLRGEQGEDRLRGDAGNDELFGGDDSDAYEFAGRFGNDLVYDNDGKRDLLVFQTLNFTQVKARRSGKDLIITTPAGVVRVAQNFDECRERVEGFRFKDGDAKWGGGGWARPDALVRTSTIPKSDCDKGFFVRFPKIRF